MRRPLAVITLLALLPTGLIGFRLYEQEAALHGPTGGSGVVEGTEIRLASKIGARVLEIAASEGDAVKAGDLVLKLDCAEPEAALAEAEARLASARAQADAAARGRDVAGASSQAARAQAEAVAAQRDAASRQADRIGALDQDVAASAVDQTSSGAAALGHQADAARASARASTLQASAAEANAVAAARAVEAAEAAVSRARLTVGECEVRAPRDAVVETLPWEPGEMAPPGGALAVLVDLSEVHARFWVPNAEIAAVVPKAEALVEADAYPGLPFPGRVETVALSAEFTPRNVQTRTDRDRLVYAVDVVVPNPGAKLRPGMPVQVTLPGTER